jgi:polyisoprenoid-binding protein YceI
VSTVSTGALLPPAQLPGVRDVSKVAAGTYKLEPDHTQVLFTFNHLGFTDYTGQFVQPSGSLTIDPAHLNNSKVDVTFAIARVSTTSAHLDQALQTAEFFDAAKFPEAHFTSTKVVANDTDATIYGNLTIKGVTKPVTLQARLVGAGTNPRPPNKATVGFAAIAAIKRSHFGISFGVPIVSDRVDLVINAAFEAE